MLRNSPLPIGVGAHPIQIVATQGNKKRSVFSFSEGGRSITELHTASVRLFPDNLGFAVVILVLGRWQGHGNDLARSEEPVCFHAQTGATPIGQDAFIQVFFINKYDDS